MNHNILVVDPILRGSRLVNSSLAIAGFLQKGWTAHLLTRRDAITEHYQELLGTSSHHLHPTIPVPAGTWFDKLSSSAVCACMDEIERLTKEHRITGIFFTGWNEFFPALPLKVWRKTKSLNSLPCFAIDYAPSFWLRLGTSGFSRHRFKPLVKQAITWLALKRFETLKFLLLDERVVSAEKSHLPARWQHRYAWIPDPASVPERKEPQPLASSTLPSVLVIGLQTARKGLVDIVELIEHSPQNLPVRFHFVGRLAKDTEHLRSRLKALPARFFLWNEGFWPEEVIQRHYSEADFVILPYDRSFDCSSAVLATACGHGRPVVVTNHGVIGFRVHRHNLGFSYASRNVSTLMKVLQQIPTPGSPDYQTVSANCRGFAQANSIGKYQEAVCEIISQSGKV